MNPEIIWRDSLALIKDRIAFQTFQTWFEPLKAARLEDSSLTLQVPSQFYSEWLDSHYRGIILEALRSASGRDLQVQYSIVDLEPEPEAPKTIFPTARQNGNGFSEATRLNIRYTFENFIEGAGNQFAKAAALAICDRLNHTSFNPLVIYGGVGLGKTHLLQAIGNRVLTNEARSKVIYVTSEKFTLDFITSIQRNKTATFSKYYRNVDMLLVDDIQFFQNKEQTQEQFFHTFNDLFQRGKQIVMTLDRPPADLSGLQDRLLSRFQSGLIVDIHPPELETRIAILMRKAEAEHLDIPYEATEYIASCIKTNVRDLEGALIRLLAYSSLRKEEITLDLARKVVLETLGRQAARNTTVDEVIRQVADEFDVKENALVGKSRIQNIAMARQIAMYIAREVTDASLMSIGMHLGSRDHSTVIHACKKVTGLLAHDEALKARVTALQEELSNNVY